MTHENRFNVGPDEWEDIVFTRAAYFTTFRLHGGRHYRDTRKFNTFPEALRDARKDRQALVYAVTATGRQACLEQGKWDHFMELWNEGQKTKTATE